LWGAASAEDRRSVDVAVGTEGQTEGIGSAVSTGGRHRMFSKPVFFVMRRLQLSPRSDARLTGRYQIRNVASKIQIVNL